MWISTFSKKVPKSDPKTDQRIFHFALIATLRPLFAKKFWNRDFKTSLLGGIWLPPIFFSIKNQKIPDRRTDERTDTRNTQFWLSDGRKERFAQLATKWWFERDSVTTQQDYIFISSVRFDDFQWALQGLHDVPDSLMVLVAEFWEIESLFLCDFAVFSLLLLVCNACRNVLTSWIRPTEFTWQCMN